jgi:DNA-binding transcriptional LysR family regulator
MAPIDLVSRRIKLQHFSVVAAVAQTGSMGKAARQLAISQPVVSKVIADLEQMLGVRLFDRSARGVEPTFYGRALLKRSVALFDDIKTSVEEIRFLADPTAGELRVGMTEASFAGLGASIVEQLWLRHPRLSVRVLQAESAALLNHDLPARRIELAVTPMPVSALPDELDAKILFQDRMHVVAGVKSRWVRRPKITSKIASKITWADLVDEPWCVPPLENPDNLVGAAIADAFAAVGFKPRIAVATSPSPHLVARMLENGRLLGLMTDTHLRFFLAKRFAVRKLPIELPHRPWSVAIIRLRHRTISPAAQLFIDCASAIGKQLTR